LREDAKPNLGWVVFLNVLRERRMQRVTINQKKNFFG
jgi:hypothetical protein